ncbi:hypothetical protein DK37_16515 [Halomonas sp. SUBG004]|nr:hypothetical protein DK37_16515 [Halomonas sp. SUBG004]
MLGVKQLQVSKLKVKVQADRAEQLKHLPDFMLIKTTPINNETKNQQYLYKLHCEVGKGRNLCSRDNQASIISSGTGNIPSPPLV